MLRDGGVRRRRLSMTSLIDVIFLLLLFFMLTSTFSRFGEIVLTTASDGGTDTSATPPLFLKLGPDELHLNGRESDLDALPDRISDLASDTEARVLVSLDDRVDAQRLADLLVLLAALPDLAVTVLD